MRDYESGYGDRRPVRVVKKGGFLGKFVALLLGVVIGAAGAIGGLVGGGYYIVTQVKINDAMNAVNGVIDPDVDYTQYIDGSYGEKTVMALVGDTYAAVSKLVDGSGTLNDLNAILPIVGTTVHDLVTMVGTDYDVELNEEEIMSCPMSEMGTYFQGEAGEIPLSSVLKILNFKGNEVITALCYGIKDEHYTVDPTTNEITMIEPNTEMTLGEFAGEGLDAHINALPIDVVIDISMSDAVMCALAYGTENRYYVDGGEVKMNQVIYTVDTSNVTSLKIYDDHGEEVTFSALPELISGNAGTADAVWKVETAELGVHYLKACSTTELSAYKDEACTIPRNYKKVTIGDLENGTSDLIDNITLEAAFGLKPSNNPNPLLLTLAFGAKYTTNVEDDKYECDAPRTIGDLKTKGVELFNDVTLGDALGLKPSDDPDSLLLALAYGSSYTVDTTNDKYECDEPRTIGDLKTKGVALLDDLYLYEILPANVDNQILMYILYGKKDIHYTLSDENVVTMQQKWVAISNDVVYNEYGEALNDAYIDETSYHDPDGNTYTLTTTSETIEFGDITATKYLVSDENGAVKFKATTIGDLRTGDLFSKITDRLTLADVFTTEQLEMANGNIVLKNLTSTTLSHIPETVAALTIDDVFHNDIYKRDESGELTKEVNALWWYLLYDKGTNTIQTERKLSEGLNILTTYMAQNVHDATMEKLINDGIIIINDEDDKTDFLNAKIPAAYASDYDTDNGKLCELTAEQLVDLMLEITKTLN